MLTYLIIWLEVLEEKLICHLFVYVKLVNQSGAIFDPRDLIWTLVEVY